MEMVPPISRAKISLESKGKSTYSNHKGRFSLSVPSVQGAAKVKWNNKRGFVWKGDIKTISIKDCNAGVGGLRFTGSFYNGTGKSWRSGDNGGFTRYDSQQHGDPVPGNGRVDWNVYLSSNQTKARIVMTWLNRGTYTYNNRNNAHPIGTDYDIAIYDPDGNWVAGSYSWDNSFEMVEFDPQKTGNYRVSISRYANRDTGARTIMSTWVRYWY